MDFKELIVYKKAFNLAMEVYEVSKDFPKEEKYSLTDRSGDLPDLFVQILLKFAEKDCM